MQKPRIAILGSQGRLGAALVRKWQHTHALTPFARPEFDLLSPESIDTCFQKHAFDWVINCAALTNVDACEQDRESAFAANAQAPRHIAQKCQETGARLIHISTDYVFDGAKNTPYLETDSVAPISIYGESKAAGEAAVSEAAPNSIIARVSWVFGPEKPSFVDSILNKARTEPAVAAVADKWSNPTYTDDLADWLQALIEQSASAGTYHLCNTDGCSWRDYGEHALKCADAAGLSLKTTTVNPLKISDITAFVAQRPVYTVMSSEKFTTLTGISPRPWQDAVRSYIESIATSELVRS